MIEFNQQKALLKRLIHRKDCYATQWDNGQGYWRKKEPLTEEVLQKHLMGAITVGAYQLVPDNTVKWGVLDFDEDTHEDWLEAFNAFELLKTQGYGCILEKSAGGVYRAHVWLLPPKPIPAAQMKAFLESFCKDNNFRPHEIFPKQTELSKDRPFGNLVKLPFGLNHKSGVFSNIVEVANL